MGGVAALGAGRVGHRVLIIVAQSLHGTGLSLGTAGAASGLLTGCGAGGRRGLGPVAPIVIQGRDRHRVCGDLVLPFGVGEAAVADRAAPMPDVAAFRAAGIRCRNVLQLVVVLANDGIGVVVGDIVVGCLPEPDILIEGAGRPEPTGGGIAEVRIRAVRVALHAAGVFADAGRPVTVAADVFGVAGQIGAGVHAHIAAGEGVLQGIIGPVALHVEEIKLVHIAKAVALQGDTGVDQVFSVVGVLDPRAIVAGGHALQNAHAVVRVAGNDVAALPILGGGIQQLEDKRAVALIAGVDGKQRPIAGDCVRCAGGEEHGLIGGLLRQLGLCPAGEAPAVGVDAHRLRQGDLVVEQGGLLRFRGAGGHVLDGAVGLGGEVDPDGAVGFRRDPDLVELDGGGGRALDHVAALHIVAVDGLRTDGFAGDCHGAPGVVVGHGGDGVGGRKGDADVFQIGIRAFGGIVDAVHGLDGNGAAPREDASTAGEDHGREQAVGVLDAVVGRRVIALLGLEAVEAVILLVVAVGRHCHPVILGQLGAVHAGGGSDGSGLAGGVVVGDLAIDGVAEAGVEVLREERHLGVEGQDVAQVIAPVVEGIAVVELRAGGIGVLGGGIQPVVAPGIVVMLPGLDPGNDGAAGVADLLRRGGEALVEPGVHAVGVGVVDQVLILVHHGAVGAFDAGLHLVVGVRIGHAGVGVDVQNGQAVVEEIEGIEKACNVGVPGLPAVVDVVVQDVEPAVSLGSVGVVAEGGLHEIELAVKLRGCDVSKAGINGIQGIDVGGGGGGRPDVAVLAHCQALELHGRLTGGGFIFEDDEGSRVTDLEGGLQGFGGLQLLLRRRLGQLLVDVDPIRPGLVHGGAQAAGNGVGAHVGLDQTGHVAGGATGVDGGGGVVDHNVVAHIAIFGILIQQDAALDAPRRRTVGRRLCGVGRNQRGQQGKGQENAERFANRFHSISS